MLDQVVGLMALQSLRLDGACGIARIEEKVPGPSLAAGRHVKLNMLVMRIQTDEIGVIAQSLADPIDIIESFPAQTQAEAADPSGMPFLFCHLFAIGTIPSNVVYLEPIDLLLS